MTAMEGQHMNPLVSPTGDAVFNFDHSRFRAVKYYKVGTVNGQPCDSPLFSEIWTGVSPTPVERFEKRDMVRLLPEHSLFPDAVSSVKGAIQYYRQQTLRAEELLKAMAEETAPANVGAVEEGSSWPQASAARAWYSVIASSKSQLSAG